MASDNRGSIRSLAPRLQAQRISPPERGTEPMAVLADALHLMWIVT